MCKIQINLCLNWSGSGYNSSYGGWMTSATLFGSILEASALARGLSEGAFAQRMGGPVLIAQIPPEESRSWSYKTESARVIQDKVRGNVLLITQRDLVFHVRKHKQTSFASTVLIGRASSNDIILDHSTVSKLHVRIRARDDASLELTDAGSSNGTRCEGRLLAPNIPLILENGMEIQLGACRCFFMHPEYFYQVLHKYFAA